MKSFIFLITLIGAIYWVSKRAKTFHDVENIRPRSIGLAIMFMFFVILVLSSINVVPAGQRGVVFSQASGVEKRVLQEGINIVIPFVESVILMDVRIDKKSANGVAASKDLQNVTVHLLVNYHPIPDKVNDLYQHIGVKEQYESKIIDPSVQESVKAITPRFTAVEIIQKRNEIKEDAVEILTKRLAKNFLVLDDISIVNIEFDPEFTKAIEDKVRQEQVYQKELLAVKTAEAFAQQEVAKADGVKQSTILKAQGIAEQNKLIAASTTALVLQQLAIEKWDGAYPYLYSPGSDSNFILDLSKVTQP